MNKEMDQMKGHDVYEEVSTDNVDQEIMQHHRWPMGTQGQNTYRSEVENCSKGIQMRS